MPRAHRAQWGILVFIACSALPGGLTTARAATTISPATPQDRAFLADAAQVNMAELRISQAVENRVTEPLNALAAMYVTDHTASLATLRKLAADLAVSTPTAPSRAQRAEATQIESQNGRALSVAYAQASIVAHRQAITMFTREVSAGGDRGVRGYARSSLPVLRKHLAMATQAASELGVPISKLPAGAPATGGGGTVPQPWPYIGGVAAAGLAAGLAAVIWVARRRRA